MIRSCVPVVVLFASSLLAVFARLEDFACSTGEFECSAAKVCIPGKWKCDGEKDCSDGKDEVGCGGEITCKSGMYKCQEGRCIEASWICDGHADCPNKDDESSIQNCKLTTCSPNDFQCRNGECIQGSFKCDFESDCEDESDEQGCPALVCTADQFLCANNRTCISTKLKCNGKKDCHDSSDELGCPISCDKENYFTCKDHECIPKAWRCDGSTECKDRSDEDGCPSPTPPPPCADDKFRCGNAECIPVAWKCDLYSDCIDSTDETGCPSTTTCTSTEFKCESGNCIPKSSKCDGITDCSDGSDETGCVSTPLLCKEGLFHCAISLLCINMDKVCNKIRDCPHGDDESKSCGINECQDHNGHCLHNCTDLPIGYKCSCHHGYKLADDNRACEDINECQEMYGICSQSCVNFKGSYKCLCVDGYVDDIALKMCKAKGPLPYLIFGDEHSIRKLSMSATQYDVISADRRAPMAVGHDIEAGYVYWTDVLDEKIERTPLLSDGKVETVVDKVKHSNGLAVDWIGKKLYWTDENVNSIEVSELNGDNRLVLFTVSVDDPRGIAVDPFERYLFWTDWGSVHPKIERASMDGDSVSRRVIVDTDIMWPTALTLDTILQRVYFADTKMQRIETCKYDGSSRVKLVASGVLHPLGLAVFEDYLYYTDYSLDTVFRINKLTGASSGKLKENVKRISGVNVVHPVLQRKVETRCNENNGGCSHLCLLSTNILKYSCRCPAGMVLRGDGMTCVKIGKPNDKTTESPVKTGCGVKNGGCSHKCLPSSDDKYSCRCPGEMTLSVDGRTCEKSAKPTTTIRASEKVKTGCGVKNGGCSHKCLPSSDDKYSCRCPGEMTLSVDGRTCEKSAKPTTTTRASEKVTSIPVVARKSERSSSNDGPMIAGVTVGVLVALFAAIAVILYLRKRSVAAGRSIMFYKDSSRTPLQNDFDEDALNKAPEEIGLRASVQFA